MKEIFRGSLFILTLCISGTLLGQDSSTALNTVNHPGTEKITSLKYVIEAAHNKIWTDRSVTNEGNGERIAEAMRKAINGHPITIGLIGGSITAGAKASIPQKNAYGPLVYRWWKEKFSNTKVKFVNAGIGATNSIFGVCRADSDILSKHPDFVIIEYGVNDMGEKDAEEAYEGLVRKVMKSSERPGIIALETMVDQGKNWQQYHLPVAKHYHIPMISYRDAFWPAIENKKLTWEEIGADDGIHPIDRGHAYIAGLIIHYLDSLYNNLKSIPESNFKLPSQLTANGYEKSGVGTPSNMTPVSNGSFERTNYGWVSTSKGKPLEFHIRCGYLWVGFFRTNDSTGARAYALIDGKKKVALDADFINGWGNYTGFTQLIKEHAVKEHTIAFYFNDNRIGRKFIINNMLIANY